MQHLNKDKGDDTLFDNAYHVLDSLDVMRSCCLLADITNEKFTTHDDNPEAALLNLVNKILDILV
jgi:hypothetical protein